MPLNYPMKEYGRWCSKHNNKTRVFTSCFAMKVSILSSVLSLVSVLCVSQITFAAEETTVASLANKIKHVIVLMLENRSFDHMLGFLKKYNKDINGCLPNESGCSNSFIPNDPSSGTVTVDDTAVYVQVSPHHSIDWTSEQIYGIPKEILPTIDDTPTMDGFIYSYADEFEGKTTPEALEKGAGVMKCFSPEHVPIMTNLSMEYGVFDGWFASVPGPTMVNRAYAGSGTSDGMGTNDDIRIALGYPQKSMYKQLREMGLDYRVYYQGEAVLLRVGLCLFVFYLILFSDICLWRVHLCVQLCVHLCAYWLIG